MGNDSLESSPAGKAIKFSVIIYIKGKLCLIGGKSKLREHERYPTGRTLWSRFTYGSFKACDSEGYR